MSKKNIAVLIVDDSAVMRQVFKKLLNSHGIVNVDTAASAQFAQRKIERRRPNVIILDLEMPEIDGLTFLDQIMSRQPIPVIVCSTHTRQSAPLSIEALERGALECIAKPTTGLQKFLEKYSRELAEKVLAAAVTDQFAAPTNERSNNTPFAQNKNSTAESYSAPYSAASRASEPGSQAIALVGASAGGVQALETILEKLNNGRPFPAIVVVQHMPAHFTKAYAQRLDSKYNFSVVEAQNTQRIAADTVYIAPGGLHTELHQTPQGLALKVVDGDPVNMHKPAVDALFFSAAKLDCSTTTGLILTGMGADGAKGLLALREKGAMTIAQSKEDCLVYGMPKAAVRIGAAISSMSLSEISQHLQAPTKISAEVTT